MIRVGSMRRAWTRGEQPVDILAPRQRGREDIGRRHRILDGEIDSDAADRRHRMGGIADRQQARADATASTGRARPSAA